MVALAQPPSHLSTRDEENPDVTHGGRSQNERMYYTTHINIILRAQGELWRQAGPAQWLLMGSDPNSVERSQGSQNPQVVSEKYKQISEPLEPPPRLCDDDSGPAKNSLAL